MPGEGLATVRRYLGSLLLIAAIHCFPASGQAQLALAFGAGTQSCGAFLIAADNERREWSRSNLPRTEVQFMDNQYFAFVMWIEGFLTAINFERSAYNNYSGRAGIIAFIENYCRNRPTDSVLQGALSLADTFRSQTPAAPNPSVRR
jgi:hypothetical protein